MCPPWRVNSPVTAEAIAVLVLTAPFGLPLICGPAYTADISLVRWIRAENSTSSAPPCDTDMDGPPDSDTGEVLVVETCGVAMTSLICRIATAFFEAVTAQLGALVSCAVAVMSRLSRTCVFSSEAVKLASAVHVFGALQAIRTP